MGHIIYICIDKSVPQIFSQSFVGIKKTDFVVLHESSEGRSRRAAWSAGFGAVCPLSRVQTGDRMQEDPPDGR